MAGRQARPVFPNGPFYVKGLSLFGFAMFNMTGRTSSAQCADDMNQWHREGRLKAVIGKTVPARGNRRGPSAAGGQHAP